MKRRTYQAGKKIESRVEKDSVKIWELDSDNSDVYSDSFVEIDTDESSNSSRSTGILSMQMCMDNITMDLNELDDSSVSNSTKESL